MTESQVVGHIIGELAAGRGGWVVTHNLDHLRRLTCDPHFRRACEGATLRVADGMPVLWASWFAGTPLPQRVAGSSLIYSLSEAAARAGNSIFLLGGNPGTAARAGERLTQCYPGLRVVGTMCPPLGFERDRRYMRRLLARLRSARPDIAFVGLGSPKQEYLIERLHRLLPRTWFLGVGISFSFVCGELPRAPRVLQCLGLEWMHRLAHEPRRLARRYLLQGIPFAMQLFATAVWQRFGREPAMRPSHVARATGV